MGCDIHFHTEIKVDGEWYHWSRPYAWRWYELFGKMGMTRRWAESDPVSELRGLPKDISKMTQLAHTIDDDVHSESWLSSKDILRVIRWFYHKRKEMSDNPGLEMYNYFGLAPWGSWLDIDLMIPPMQDFRFVFWFDN